MHTVDIVHIVLLMSPLYGLQTTFALCCLLVIVVRSAICWDTIVGLFDRSPRLLSLEPKHGGVAANLLYRGLH
jgi:hypothetical protein